MATKMTATNNRWHGGHHFFVAVTVVAIIVYHVAVIVYHVAIIVMVCGHYCLWPSLYRLC